MDGRAELGRALERLYARVPLGMRLGLAPMRAACSRAGHPERAFEVVHVAGTNGKGSTSAMIASMARAAGRRTGLYTSPHLCRFAERIRIDGEPIDDRLLVRVLEEALDVGVELSFFETATLAALLAFRARGVDLAVLEVGIGGRLDATNVVTPKVTAITRVAFDHMDRLGDTLEAIAFEKAGIAKASVPLVLGPLLPGPRSIVEAAARDVGAPIVDAPEDEGVALPPAMPASYQIDNAKVAVAVAKILGLSPDSMARGLRDARWPGRFERIEAADGAYLLDGAHNPDGARALAQSLMREANAPGAMIFGAMADKAWSEVLDVLAPHVAHRVYVAPKGRQPASLDALSERHAGARADDLPEALSLARRHVGSAGTVLVTGSLYLVGEVRAKLLDLPQDPPVAL